MPAYRSDAEGEVRNAVVARLREIRPASRIIHEINLNGMNRADVLAVGRSEIIAVEIKSEKDKLDRLPAQIAAMRRAAHHVIAAVHEKFLVESECSEWSAHSKRDGHFFMGLTPNQMDGAIAWVFPERQRSIADDRDCLYPWKNPTEPIQKPLPADALHILWRDELFELCGKMKISVPRRANMQLMVNALRWNATGAEITKGICAALLTRHCAEADPALEACA